MNCNQVPVSFNLPHIHIIELCHSPQFKFIFYLSKHMSAWVNYFSKPASEITQNLMKADLD